MFYSFIGTMEMAETFFFAFRENKIRSSLRYFNSSTSNQLSTNLFRPTSFQFRSLITHTQIRLHNVEFRRTVSCRILGKLCKTRNKRVKWRVIWQRVGSAQPSCKNYKTLNYFAFATRRRLRTREEFHTGKFSNARSFVSEPSRLFAG